VVEEIADMSKDARVMCNSIVYGGGECLTQSLATLFAPLRCQSGQSRGEMVVARHDDADGWYGC
jgi:hypothetical protein